MAEPGEWGRGGSIPASVRNFLSRLATATRVSAHRATPGRTFALASAAISAAVAAGLVFAAAAGAFAPPRPVTEPATTPQGASSQLPSFPEIVDAVKPSVIGVRSRVSRPHGDQPFSESPAEQRGLFDVPEDTPGGDTPGALVQRL